MMQGGRIQLAIKRLVDLLVSALGLLFLSPFGVLIAMAIKSDSPGPVFFRQERLGLRGEPFRVLKFRTMVVGAPDGAVKKGDLDPRITKVGAFLRRWSLDEIPQLYNVLKGDMSLVGPRPDRVFRLPGYTGHQKQRLLVKPGITGLAQINGRNAIPWEQRYELDIAYIDAWSIWLDAKILLKTAGAILSKRGIDTG